MFLPCCFFRLGSFFSPALLVVDLKSVALLPVCRYTDRGQNFSISRFSGISKRGSTCYVVIEGEKEGVNIQQILPQK